MPFSFMGRDKGDIGASVSHLFAGYNNKNSKAQEELFELDLP
jgi:hypothetical protein